MRQTGIFEGVDARNNLVRRANDGNHVGELRNDKFFLILARINDMTFVQREMTRVRGQPRGIFFIPLDPLGNCRNRR